MNNPKYWTIPCDVNYYNIVKAFDNINCIEWKQNLKNIQPNDIVYIYIGKPYFQIMYKCKVVDTSLSQVTIDDKKYWRDASEYGMYDKYMQLQLLEKYAAEKFKYNIIKNFGFTNRRSQASASIRLVNYIEASNNNDYDYYKLVNKKRVDSKKEWLKILDNEKQDDNKILDILFYLYDCKNYTSNAKTIAKDLNSSVAALNSYVSSFGTRVVKLLDLDEQIGDNSNHRRWNIPFETVEALNSNHIFTWKLRKELVEALVEKYDLIPKSDISINEEIKHFTKEYPYEIFRENITNDLLARQHFVDKFNISAINKMELDDFVIGKAELTEKGKGTFCYLIERTMLNLGDMRGSYVSKFGVWYSKKNDQYEFSKKYGDSLEEAFQNLKQQIINLLIGASNNDYNQITECEIANIFKGKILSTYFPDKYLCLFDEQDVNKFLNALNINYDVHVENTLEKKKKLLQEFKQRNNYFKDKLDAYFVKFLYFNFQNELKIKNTIAGEIDYNIEFVDFDYLEHRLSILAKSYRSRETDYEKINRNKKDIGNRGERAILQYEISKLNKLGLTSLAERVTICDNDAIGYDIVSYNNQGQEIHIEVKTNSGNKPYLDFYITDNELQHLKEEENYYIYYLYNIKGKPMCHIVDKEMILKREKEYLHPVIYKVNINVSRKR